MSIAPTRRFEFVFGPYSRDCRFQGLVQVYLITIQCNIMKTQMSVQLSRSHNWDSDKRPIFTNTIGSYLCSCKEEYWDDGRTCNVPGKRMLTVAYVASVWARTPVRTAKIWIFLVVCWFVFCWGIDLFPGSFLTCYVKHT